MSNPSFPQFSTLPAELRIRIWKYASTSPSIIAFKANDGRPFGITDASRVAGVCTESRDTVRTSCQRMQYRCLTGDAFVTYRYIDFENTILYLDTMTYNSSHSYYYGTQGRRIGRLGSRVRHLAVRFHDSFRNNTYRGLFEILQTLIVFRDLEMLVILVEPPAGRDVKLLRDYRDLQRLRQLIDGEIESFENNSVLDLYNVIGEWMRETSKKLSWNPRVRIVASDVM